MTVDEVDAAIAALGPTSLFAGYSRDDLREIVASTSELDPDAIAADHELSERLGADLLREMELSHVD